MRAELIRVLGDWENSVAAPPAATGRDPAFREKLEALGYIRTGVDEGPDETIAR